MENVKLNENDKKEINVIITTLSVSNGTDINLYECDGDNGNRPYFFASQQQVPGTLYFMSKKVINHIFVIGSEDTIDDDFEYQINEDGRNGQAFIGKTDVVKLCDINFENKDTSKHSFWTYLNGLNAEINTHEFEKKQKLNNWKETKKVKLTNKEDEIDKTLSDLDERAYIQIKENKSCTIQFLYQELQNIKNNIDDFVKKHIHDEIHFFIDVQGGHRTQSSILNNLLQTIKLFNTNICIDQIVSTDFNPNRTDANKIKDETSNVLSSDLINAIKVFKTSCRTEEINNYFSMLEEKPEIIKDLNNLSESILLGYVDTTGEAINQIYSKSKISKDDDSSYIKNINCNNQIKDIDKVILCSFVIDLTEEINNSGIIDANNNINWLKYVEWCYNKSFIQQALTIIETYMPTFINQEFGIKYMYRKPDCIYNSSTHIDPPTYIYPLDTNGRISEDFKNSLDVRVNMKNYTYGLNDIFYDVTSRYLDDIQEKDIVSTSGDISSIGDIQIEMNNLKGRSNKEPYDFYRFKILRDVRDKVNDDSRKIYPIETEISLKDRKENVNNKKIVVDTAIYNNDIINSIIKDFLEKDFNDCVERIKDESINRAYYLINNELEDKLKNENTWIEYATRCGINTSEKNYSYYKNFRRRLYTSAFNLSQYNTNNSIKTVKISDSKIIEISKFILKNPEKNFVEIKNYIKAQVIESSSKGKTYKEIINNLLVSFNQKFLYSNQSIDNSKWQGEIGNVPDANTNWRSANASDILRLTQYIRCKNKLINKNLMNYYGSNNPAKCEKINEDIFNYAINNIEIIHKFAKFLVREISTPNIFIESALTYKTNLLILNDLLNSYNANYEIKINSNADLDRLDEILMLQAAIKTERNNVNHANQSVNDRNNYDNVKGMISKYIELFYAN